VLNKLLTIYMAKFDINGGPNTKVSIVHILERLGVSYDKNSRKRTHRRELKRMNKLVT